MIHPLASRRQFLSGTAIAGAASLLPGTAGWAAIHPPRVVSVVTRSIEVKRKAATVYGLVADDGKRGLTFTAGDSFYVRLDNKLSESTMVHWHGLTPPARQDGVPGLSYDPIAAGKSETYDFRLTEPGTHWMHSHFSLTQIQRLMASPLIIRSPEDNRADEQEVGTSVPKRLDSETASAELQTYSIVALGDTSANGIRLVRSIPASTVLLDASTAEATGPEIEPCD